MLAALVFLLAAALNLRTSTGDQARRFDLAVVIACSEIVVAQPRSPMPSLPGGVDDVDIAVLDCISAEGPK
jgi:hypothetical protein